jgi:D-serine deaminase-like pyridoxal phosphate-dependent protein
MTIRKHTPKDNLDTPAVTIDLDIMDRNISRLAEMAGANNIQLRPHIKTHKTSEIADLQLKAGAVAIPCAKIGEAEIMIEKSKATVISVPSSDRTVIDAGSKSVTSESISKFGVFGLIKGRPDLRFVDANEERGMLRMTSPKRKLKVGDRLEIIPNHVCPVMNLHDEAVGIRNGRLETVWAIAARGKIR